MLSSVNFFFDIVFFVVIFCFSLLENQKRHNINSMKSKLLWIFVILIILSGGSICFFYYSYLFPCTVQGEVIDVHCFIEKPSTSPSEEKEVPHSFEKSPFTTPTLFSPIPRIYAVAVQNEKGEIFTAPSRHRQWAVIKKGQCVKAKFLPHPPWNLSNFGTYCEVRPIQVFECPASLKSQPRPSRQED